jgi:benzoate-CoA ligase
VVLKEWVQPIRETGKELKQWVLDRLAKYKYPRWIEFVR